MECVVCISTDWWCLFILSLFVRIVSFRRETIYKFCGLVHNFKSEHIYEIADITYLCKFVTYETSQRGKLRYLWCEIINTKMKNNCSA